MDNRSEVRQFLATRRAKITPEQAGLPFYGGNRRVPGLRREEVAMMAGVSADYYTRLEKGNLAGVSDSVLNAVARALHLNEAEQAHLFDLARTANTAPSRVPRRQAAPKIRPSVLRVLHSMTTTAAFVRNGRLDVLAINQLGRALYWRPFSKDPHRPTWPGSTSSTPARPTSIPTGTTPPTPPSRYCTPRPRAPILGLMAMWRQKRPRGMACGGDRGRQAPSAPS